MWWSLPYSMGSGGAQVAEMMGEIRSEHPSPLRSLPAEVAVNHEPRRGGEEGAIARSARWMDQRMLIEMISGSFRMRREMLRDASLRVLGVWFTHQAGS